jgi:uncharacterized protein (PEP-CTERM system associated)
VTARRYRPSALSLLLGAPLLVVTPAHAEGWRVTSALTTRVIASDNINFSAISPKSDSLLEVNPGVTLTRSSPRLQLNASYRPRYFHYFDDTYDSRVAHNFDASGAFEVIDDLFFLNGRAVSAERNLSVFNAVPTDNQLAPDQLGRTRTYSLTPSFRGTVRLGDVATWRSSYNIVRSESTGSINASSLTSETFNGTLASTPAKLGWQLDVNSAKTTSDIARSTDRQRVTGSFIYQHDATLRLVTRYGYEDTNFANQRSGNTYGVGFNWNPSLRTSFNGDFDDRPYASTSSFGASHRMPRASFSANYRRSLTNRAEQILSPSGVTDLAESLSLLEPFASEPDPAERLRLVENFLRDNGLQRFQVGLSPILSDRQFLQTRWQVSATRTGIRNSVSLSYFRTESDSGIGGIGAAVGDDFALSPVIRQTGWTASYSHRVSTDSSINVSLTSSKSNGSAGSGFGANRDLLNATWSTRLGTRSNGSIGLRMTRATVNAGDVDENAVIATLTTRFN